MTSPTWREDMVLIAELSSLNTQIATYVLRTLDVDAGRAEPVNAFDEHRLGARLIKVGKVLQTKSADRRSEIRHAVIVEGEDTGVNMDEPKLD